MPTTSPQNGPLETDTPPAGSSVTPPSEQPHGPTSEEQSTRRKDTSAEAAGYRHRLRESEERESATAAKLIAAHRREVERTIGMSGRLIGSTGEVQTLHRPADLWDVLGAEPDAFHDDAGEFDPVAVADYIAEHAADRPYLLKPIPAPISSTPLAASASTTRPPATGDTGSAWQSAIRGNH